MKLFGEFFFHLNLRESTLMAEGCGLCPHHLFYKCAVIKITPALPETWVQSVGGEDPLKKEMATHSGILAWGIPWTEEPGRLPWSMGSQEYLATKQEQQLRLSLLPFDSQFFRSLSGF